MIWPHMTNGMALWLIPMFFDIVLTPNTGQHLDTLLHSIRFLASTNFDPAVKIASTSRHIYILYSSIENMYSTQATNLEDAKRTHIQLYALPFCVLYRVHMYSIYSSMRTHSTQAKNHPDVPTHPRHKKQPQKLIQ